MFVVFYLVLGVRCLFCIVALVVECCDLMLCLYCFVVGYSISLFLVILLITMLICLVLFALVVAGICICCLHLIVGFLVVS